MANRKTYIIAVLGWKRSDDHETSPADYYGEHKVRSTSLEGAFDLAEQQAVEAFGASFESVDLLHIVRASERAS